MSTFIELLERQIFNPPPTSTKESEAGAKIATLFSYVNKIDLDVSRLISSIEILTTHSTTEPDSKQAAAELKEEGLVRQRDRLRALQEKTQVFAKDMGFNNPSKINVSLLQEGITGIASAYAETYEIKIPPVFLLTSEEVKNLFNIEQFSLADLESLDTQRFQTWCMEYLGLEGNKDDSTPMLQFTLNLLLEDEDLAKEAIDATLCHELGHLWLGERELGFTDQIDEEVFCDHKALTLMGKKEGFQYGFRTALRHLGNFGPPTHPSVLERIEAAERIVNGCICRS